MPTIRLLVFSLLLACSALDAAGANAIGARRELQIRQQQDALNLNIQQSIRGRADVSPADARRLEQLDLQQRLQQQQLDNQQLHRHELLQRQAETLPPGIADARLRAERDIYDQQRLLQSQQFELDRQRLLQSMPREPLQSPAGGALRLP